MPCAQRIREIFLVLPSFLFHLGRLLMFTKENLAHLENKSGINYVVAEHYGLYLC